MCGLVGLVADKLNINHWEMMEKLLWMDSIRGYHSTGVTAVSNKKGNTLKLAMDGAEFTQTVGWADFYKENKDAKALLGHNRWATSGAVNETNAHPFTHSHITMMHNGTLVDQSLLPDSHKFVVDSDNIAYSLATKGLKHTINNLDGAYALVWHDTSDGTVNFIRNDERPLWFAKLKDNQGYAWASEKMMLEWLLGRTKKGLQIETINELPVGVHYSTKINKKSIQLITPTKYTLPVFDYGYNNWEKYYGGRSKFYGGTKAVATTNLANWDYQYQTMLDKYCDGLEVGKLTTLIATEFEEYNHDSNKGMLVCKIAGQEAAFVEVRLSSITKSEFKKGGKWIAEVRSCSVVNDVLRVYTKDPVEIVADSDMKVAIKPFRVTTDGTYITSDDWLDNYIKTCYMCGDDVKFEELDHCCDIDLTESGQRNTICGSCSNHSGIY
jgi:hypothetical protein